MTDKYLILLRRRPLWMNFLMLFCAYMAVIYVPWDFLFKTVSDDQEVWFGLMLTGWWAKLTEPVHWAIYTAGAWGFWHMRAWMHPWAALYVVQIAVGMCVWSLRNSPDTGAMQALLISTPFLLIGLLLWRSRARFTTRADDQTEPTT